MLLFGRRRRSNNSKNLQNNINNSSSNNIISKAKSNINNTYILANAGRGKSDHAGASSTIAT